MELAVSGAEGLGEPNERVGDRSDNADTSPAAFNALALNFLLQPSHSPKSLGGLEAGGGRGATSSSAGLEEVNFSFSSLLSLLNFGHIVLLINGIVKLSGKLNLYLGAIGVVNSLI